MEEDEVYIEEIEEEVCDTDPRRFTIFFKINGDKLLKINNLKTGQYVRIKNFDAEALRYCQKIYTNKKIEQLFISTDDVEYRPVNLATQRKEVVQEACHADNSKSNTNTTASTVEAVECTETLKDNNDNKTKYESSYTINNQSAVWTHVKLLTGKKEWRCLHCQKIFKYSGNTTNMNKHLSSIHPNFFTNLNKRKRESDSTGNSSQMDIASAFQRVTSFQRGTLSDDITNTILYMICKDVMPFSTVEKDGFLTLMKKLAPLYSVPSLKTIILKMECKYKILKDNFIKEIDKAFAYCITCDNWSDISMESYMGVTIHFFTESLEWKSRILGCFPLCQRHTAYYLQSILLNIFQDMHINIGKISAIISDGEAAIKKACQAIVSKEKHLVCAAHEISHVIPDAFNSLKKEEELRHQKEELDKGEMKQSKFTPKLLAILEKLREVVKTIKRSIVASDKLRALQIDAGKTEGRVLKLQLDVPTRWTSIIEMVSKYILLEPYVFLAMSECSNPIDVLSREEVKLMKDLLQIIQPIGEAITAISGEMYSTSSLLIPIINGMENCISETLCSTELVADFKQKILFAISYRFKKLEFVPLLSVATMLDPRFKKYSFKNPLAVVEALKIINCELKKNERQRSENEQEEKENDTGNKVLESVEINKHNKRSIWDSYDAAKVEREKKVVQDANESDYHSELNFYLKSELLSRSSDSFKYWKENSNSFPNLSKLGLKYLSVLSTSVPSERLFSKAGQIKSEIRNRLSSEHLNMLLFLCSFSKEEWN